MSRRPTLPRGFHLWSEPLRRKWVDDYNASLPERNAKIAERNETRYERALETKRKYKNTPTPDGYQWLNTGFNPRASPFGFDAGRTGWKFHAVQSSPKQTFGSLENKTAACGMRPRHGWTLDLFMDEDDEVAGKCVRCLKQLANLAPKEGKEQS